MPTVGHNRFMTKNKITMIILCLSFLVQGPAFSAASKRVQKNNLAMTDAMDGLDSFYDPKTDYSKFEGRVSDRDPSSQILKVFTEYRNIKFFRAGDKVRFQVGNLKDMDFCDAHVRSVEKRYFVVYVKDLNSCWGRDSYFRRGTQLFLKSDDLARRIKESSLYRVVLIKRKKDFFNQLNKINHFIWSFDQQRIKVVAEYDKQIIEIQKKKRAALDLLLSRKKDKVNLQKELVYRLDVLDRDLDFYRIERDEKIIDRWSMDHDLGLPIKRSPQNIKRAEN